MIKQYYMQRLRHNNNFNDLVLALLFFGFTIQISAQSIYSLERYYPLDHENEWRYTAPEGWKDGDYISSIVEDQSNFRDYLSHQDDGPSDMRKFYGDKWPEISSYKHYDATKAAKLLQANTDGIYYIGEEFSGAESFVLFDRPIHWLKDQLVIGDKLDEQRTFTRYYTDGKVETGTFSLIQEISGTETVTTSAGTYEDCIRIEFKTYWNFGSGSEAQSINVYHHASEIGVVKASARFIILKNGRELINRLVEPDLKSYTISNQKESRQLENLSANEIMRRAHEHAGGIFWSRPQSLILSGYGYFYNNGVKSTHERHIMYRVYEDQKGEAHAANGKVRIESYKKGQPIIMVTYDGEHTYDLNGKREKSEADQKWSSNFGYGVIRHAFDEGYDLEILPDDMVDGQEAYFLNIIDPKGEKTMFGICKKDYKIIKVAFDTPRGWHERIYSNFFTKKEYNWQQAGHVRLFYNGVKSNEVIWENFEVNMQLSDDLFTL